jgi:hypothetical protein
MWGSAHGCPAHQIELLCPLHRRQLGHMHFGDTRQTFQSLDHGGV